MHDDLRRRLQDLGASEDELERAEQQGWLPLLALDRLLLPGAPQYDVSDMARESGADVEQLRRLWRALGFPDVPDEMRVFTDADLAAARTALHGPFIASRSEATLLRDVRTVSAAMARVAGVVSDYAALRVHEARAAGMDDEAVALALLDGFDLSELRGLIDYEFRVQVRAALWRRIAIDTAPERPIGVGFADLTGYTELSAALDADRISDLVARFESVSYDTLTAHGARLVKTIGDEVMFVGLPPDVADAALALVDAAAEESLPPVRIGIAAGPVIARAGDFYGPVVNLASRLTEAAPDGTVLAPADICDELPDELFAVRAQGTRRLRGIGDVEAVVLERRDGDSGAQSGG